MGFEYNYLFGELVYSQIRILCSNKQVLLREWQVIGEENSYYQGFIIGLCSHLSNVGALQERSRSLYNFSECLIHI